MKIAGLVKTSTVDFPDCLAAVIFTPGCNMDCFYCHNRPLLQPIVPCIDESEVLSFLKKRQGLLDGVVFSGGEPTLQPDLTAFIQIVRKLGYQIKLDTNGTRPEILRVLIAERLVDYVAVDFKAPWHRYAEICRCQPADVQSIKQSFRLLLDAAVPWEIRTTMIPQLTLQDLTEMAGALPAVPRFILQRYNRPAVHRLDDRFRLDTTGYKPGDLVILAEKLRSLQPQIQVR